MYICGTRRLIYVSIMLENVIWDRTVFLAFVNVSGTTYELVRLFPPDVTKYKMMVVNHGEETEIDTLLFFRTYTKLAMLAFLPPATCVSCLSVILFTGGMYDVTSCLVAWSHVPSGGFSIQEEGYGITPLVLTSSGSHQSKGYASYWRAKYIQTKKFTSNGDWIRDTRTVVPLVFTLS